MSEDLQKMGKFDFVGTLLPYNKSCKTSKNRDASTQENDDGDKDTIISLIFIFLFQLRWVKLWAISFV